MAEKPDEVLLRAKSLLKAMSGMNPCLEVKDDPSPHNGEGVASESSKGVTRTPTPKASRKYPDGKTPFKVAVIHGSTLVTTMDDIHTYVSKGAHVSINGTGCQLSLESEITSKRVFLTEDFAGETCYEASLTVVENPKPKKKVTTAKKVLPKGISEAVEGLGTVTNGLLSRNNVFQSHAPKQNKQKKTLSIISPSGDGTVYQISNPKNSTKNDILPVAPPVQPSLAEDDIGRCVTFTDRVESLKHGNPTVNGDSHTATDVPSPTAMRDRFNKVAELAKAVMDTSYAIGNHSHNQDYGADMKQNPSRLPRKYRMKDTDSCRISSNQHKSMKSSSLRLVRDETSVQKRSGSAGTTSSRSCLSSRSGSARSRIPRRHSEVMYTMSEEVDTSIGAGITPEAYKGGNDDYRATALRRIAAKKREDALIKLKMQEAEEEEKIAKREADQIRIWRLREKTTERVRLLQEAKQARSEKERLEKMEKIEKKRQQDAILASDAKAKKLREMQIATLKRLKQREFEDFKRIEESEEGMKARLAELARETGRSVPTGSVQRGEQSISSLPTSTYDGLSGSRGAGVTEAGSNSASYGGTYSAQSSDIIDTTPSDCYVPHGIPSRPDRKPSSKPSGKAYSMPSRNLTGVVETKEKNDQMLDGEERSGDHSAMKTRQSSGAKHSTLHSNAENNRKWTHMDKGDVVKRNNKRVSIGGAVHYMGSVKEEEGSLLESDSLMSGDHQSPAQDHTDVSNSKTIEYVDKFDGRAYRVTVSSPSRAVVRAHGTIIDKVRSIDNDNDDEWSDDSISANNSMAKHLHYSNDSKYEDTSGSYGPQIIYKGQDDKHAIANPRGMNSRIQVDASRKPPLRPSSNRIKEFQRRISMHSGQGDDKDDDVSVMSDLTSLTPRAAYEHNGMAEHNGHHSVHRAGGSSGGDNARKKKKKSSMWRKLQPLDIAAYVPVPQQT